MNKMREKGSHTCFYTNSLNHIATSSLPRNLSLIFHYYQKFYKTHTKITLFNNGNTKIFETYKDLNPNIVRISLTDLKLHQEHN